VGATGYFQKPGDLASFMRLGKVVRDALGVGSVSSSVAG
jgi:hypothetical protein